MWPLVAPQWGTPLAPPPGGPQGYSRPRNSSRQRVVELTRGVDADRAKFDDAVREMPQLTIQGLIA